MSAHFKSHVLRREEKGFLGVPFKRLLLAGVSAGLTYTLVNLAFPASAIPAALVVGVSVVVFTAPRGGIPLWQRLLLRLRGWLILYAHRHTDHPLAQMAEMLELPLELAYLPAERLFQTTAPVAVDPSAWVLYTSASHTDGFQLLASPLEDEAP